MSKRLFYLIFVLVLSFVCTGYVSAAIIYVDATEGETGNTTFATATGEVFAPTDPGTVGSGADGLWRKRAFSNGQTIYEAGGDWSGNNTEDFPRMVTAVTLT